jgi:hypothetical protein
MKKRLEDISVAPASVRAKRARTNRQNLVRFFSEKDRFDRPRRTALKAFTPDTFIRLARLYLENEAELEHVFAYARRFKQAVDQITEADVQEAEDAIIVSEVMES